MRSHSFSAFLIFTSVHMPCSLWPRSSNNSLPLASPSADQQSVALSPVHTITDPEPFSLRDQAFQVAIFDGVFHVNRGACLQYLRRALARPRPSTPSISAGDRSGDGGSMFVTTKSHRRKPRRRETQRLRSRRATLARCGQGDRFVGGENYFRVQFDTILLRARVCGVRITPPRSIGTRVLLRTVSVRSSSIPRASRRTGALTCCIRRVETG